MDPHGSGIKDCLVINGFGIKDCLVTHGFMASELRIQAIHGFMASGQWQFNSQNCDSINTTHNKQHCFNGIAIQLTKCFRPNANVALLLLKHTA